MNIHAYEFPESTIVLVLALLEDGDQYGYQIVRELELRSDKTFLLSEGSLYPVLHSLERQGDIASYEQKSETGRIRRYYRLTRQGVRLLRKKRNEQTRYRAKTRNVIGGEACDNK